MKQYNSNIENGIKSAFFILETLRHEENIIDEDINQALSLLEKLIVKAQEANIDNVVSEN